MNDGRPKVSICIPTYNSAKYLRACLDSIVAQTYKNVEVIFSDNASTDDTISVLREYVQRYGCRLYSNETNIGAGANFNRLISLSRGNYIAIYHADDVYDETIVGASAAILDENESLGLVGTLGSIVDREGRSTREIELHDEIRKLNRKVFEFDEAMLCAIRNCFVTPSIMVRKRAYDELGGFDQQKYKSASDYEMWLRIAKRYQVAILDKKLIRYRIHENQGSEHEVRKNIEIPDIVWVLKEYRQFIKDAELGHYCDSIIEKWIYKTAKKQNYARYYEKSNRTLNLIHSFHYTPLKWMLRMLNGMSIQLKRRHDIR